MRSPIAFLPLVFLAAHSALAEEAVADTTSSEPRTRRIGIGAAIAPGELPAVYVPAELLGPGGAPDLRWEPELGFARRDKGGVTSTSYSVGLGIFGLGRVAGGVQGIYGGRLQYLRREASAEKELRLLAAVGAEWMASPGVSIGVEGQVGYAVGSSQAPGASRASTRAFATGALIVLRLYPP